MGKNIWFSIVCIIIPIALLSSLAGCKEKDANSAKNELIIFHAGSLSVPFREISAVFQKEYPSIIVKSEASGSRTAARKICDLGRECDVLASADYRVVANLLMPDYVNFNIRFALNEMVIAYTNKSRLSNNITGDNWHKILLKDEIAFGRSAPDLDPCGYRSLMVFQLAEKYYEIPGLAENLQKKGRYIRPKETDLLALLEAGEIDYLFIYRSVAAQHGLNMILLPDDINLKSPAFASLYKTATVKLSGKSPGQFITRRGEPMIYSVTIPKNAPNPKAAEAWIALLLSPKGQSIMKKNSQDCLRPPKADGFDIPASLRLVCEQQ
ncbi:MAG: extracellular solute-binding protein [Planctomycetota bacterium]|jgi:molybdate/tungstate transport system substrate-binding protein